MGHRSLVQQWLWRAFETGAAFRVIPCRRRQTPARRAVPSGFLDQSVFDKSDRHRDDRAGDAAASRIAQRRAYVDPATAGGAAESRDQALQDRSAKTSAHGARDRFEEGAQDLRKPPATFPPIAPLTI